MNTRKTAIIVALLVLWLQPLGAQQSQYLTILHLNDTHSSLLDGTPRDGALAGQQGGVARAATVIGQTAMEGGSWMLLHAGDASVGDLMHLYPAGNAAQPRIPELEILASLGLSAMTLGNHEFDFSSPGLLGALMTSLPIDPSTGKAAYPLLSANIDIPESSEIPAGDPDVSPLANWVYPSVIKEFPGFKVGIIGMTTPAANYLSDPSPVRFEEDEALLGGILYAQVGSLRDAGCNYVILLSHLGIKAARALAAAVPGIDLIISGHDHTGTKQPERVKDPLGNVVPIVQTEGFYKQIGRITLRLHNGSISINKYELIDLDSKIPEEPTVKAAVAAIAAEIEYAIGQPVFSAAVAHVTHTQTELATNLWMPGHHDTHVGNLVADAYQNGLGVDIGMIPGGSTAQPLFPGPITANDVYRMIGYGANLEDGPGYLAATFSISGYDLMVGLETTLGDIETDDELFMQVSSNLKYSYDPTQPAGSRLLDVYFQGQPLDPYAIYTVGTNWMVLEYLKMLNQMYSLGITVIDVQYEAYGEFALVLNYIMTQGTLGGRRTPGRVVAVPPMKANNNTAPPPMAKITEAGPNPFRDNATILVETEEATPLQVKVYDVLGREVATLIEGYVSGGRHSAVFQAGTLPSGLYFCRLFMADGRVQTIRMIKTR